MADSPNRRNNLIAGATVLLTACTGPDAQVAGSGGSAVVSATSSASTSSAGAGGGCTTCGDDCVDLASDDQNCGECGKACSVATGACFEGTCGGHRVVEVSAGDSFAC